MRPERQRKYWRGCLGLLIGGISIGLVSPARAIPEEPANSAGEVSLAEAISAAVTGYPKIVAERAGTEAAERSARGAKVDRAPRLVTGVEVMDHGAADVYGLAPVNGLLGLSWTTSWGTELDAKVLLGRPVLSAPEPANTASLRLEIVQPLLHGAWAAGARHEIAEAELEVERVLCSFEVLLAELVVEVHEAYHELAFAQAEVEAKRQALERAEEQLAETRRLIDKGVLAEHDVYVAEDNAVFFELEYAAAVVQLDLARRRLAELMAVEPAPIRVPPLGTGEDLANPSLADLLDHAQQHSPEVRVRRAELRLAQEELRHRRNDALPELDLGFGVSSTGLHDQFWPRLGNAMGAQQPSWHAGVTFSLPLDLPGTTAKFDAARLERDRVAIRLDAELDATRRGVEALYAQLEGEREQQTLAIERWQISRLKLEAEQEKYRRGLSTLDDVLRFQRDLDGVVTRAQHSRTRVQILHARLLQAAGLLLERSGATIDAEGSGDA